MKSLKLYVARCKEVGCSLVLFLGKPRKTVDGYWEAGPNAQSLMILNLNRFPSLAPGKCREVALFDLVELSNTVASEALWRRIARLKNGEPEKTFRPVVRNGRGILGKQMKKR